MSAVASVFLLSIAKKLAQTAKNSLPKLRDGEQVLREWYADGVYYRETRFNGETFISQYDFQQRESASHTEDAAASRDPRNASANLHKETGEKSPGPKQWFGRVTFVSQR